jgi:probable F420-dependent oxidoreductase
VTVVTALKFGASCMGIRLRSLGDACRALEEAGFESVWVPEHLAFPQEMPSLYPYTSSGQPPVSPSTPCYDPWALLSFLACATTTLRLATNICILPLRHPLQAARSIVTVDRLSGGRVTLGVGVGWLDAEFEWLGLDFHDRGAATDESICILRDLWSEEVVEHHSDRYSFGPLHFEPKPLQRPSIPIEVGGASPAALRRAAHLGDGWIEIGAHDHDELAATVDRLHGMRADAGRRDDPFEITVSAQLSHGLDAVARARDAGATRVLVSPYAGGTPLDAADVEAWAASFRDAVIDRI